MHFATRLAFAALFMLVSWSHASALPETINFEGIPAGTIVFAVFGSGPVGVSAVNPNFAVANNAAIIFDSANPTGGDVDLGAPELGFRWPRRRRRR